MSGLPSKAGALLASLLLSLPAQAQFVFDAPVRAFPDRVVDIRDVRVQARLLNEDRQLAVQMNAEVVARTGNVLQFTWPTHRGMVDSLRVEAARGDTALAVVRGDSVVFSFSEPLSTASPTTISIFFRQQAGRGMGVHGDPAHKNACCVWTERAWLPLPDDPGERFQARLSVEAPAGWSVVAGGRRTERDGVVQFVPARSVRVQDLGLVAGRFDTIRAGIVRYHLAADTEPLEDSDTELIDSVLEYVERKSGYRPPWDSVDVVVLPPTVPAITWPGVQTLRSTHSQGQPPELDTYHLAASVARQWTHGVLAPDWWTEAWVNDGLAGALALTFLEEEGVSVERVRALLADMYFEEADSYQRPLVWDRYFDPANLDDQHARYKGPLVLQTVSALVGPSVFWATMRRLLARHAFGSVDSDVLLALLEPDGPGSISRLFDAYVFAAGHPEITISPEVGQGGEEARAAITQTQDRPLVPGVFPLDTELEWLPFNQPERRGISLGDREETFVLTSALPPRYVTIDPDGHHLLRINHAFDLSAVSSRLRYGSFATRWRAADELAGFPDDPAITLTVRLALQSEADAWIRARIVRSLGRLHPSPAHQQLLADQLADESPEVRLAAAEGLLRMYPDGTANDAFDALARRETEAHIQALAVASVQGEEAEALARSALITPSEGDLVRGAGIEVLAGLSRLTGDDFLELTDPDLSASLIIQALASANSVETARPLRMRVLALMAHPDPRVRLASAQAAQSILIPGNLSSVQRLAEEEWHGKVADALAALATLLSS
ncbi:MAG: hypothetical protein HKN29_13885, partial [Rhodothermales bacterium]|nr:hypothetical protein [Rhodothermales bacterium]